QSAIQKDLNSSTDTLGQRLLEAKESQERHSSELADKLLTSVSGKVEESIGGVADGLAEMRKRFAAERQSLKKSMQGWVDHLSQANRDEDQQMAEKIRHVMEQLDSRHDGVLGALNQFSESMSSDMERVLASLLSKSDETNRELTEQVIGMGRLLEGVVTNTSREQAVFIEMLGERLDTLRKRLKIK
ncbi:MAG: hypothetical protein HQL52_03005, partial [Magnetococcales bacterium]|nr:hypothetical protein [Magnetococcales bacterium]